MKRIALIFVALVTGLVAIAPAHAVGQRIFIIVQGHGKVTDNWSEFNCSTPRSASSTAEFSCFDSSTGTHVEYVPGTPVTFTATVLDPGDGWTFVGWQGYTGSGIEGVHCNGANANDFWAGASCGFVKDIWWNSIHAIFRDTAAPATTLGSGPAAGSTTGSRSAAFTFSSS